jgi:hypothetical protein
MARLTATDFGRYTPGTLSGAEGGVVRQHPAAVVNAAFLLACISMYFGTGWSLVLFSFPVAPQLTPANYYLQFVPQVEAATRFFTYMTGAMLASAAIMIWTEWRTGYRWVPIAVLLAVVAATGLTMTLIFPLNREMSAGIATQDRLVAVLDRWMLLNRIRVGIWTVQWLAITTYFVHKAVRAPKAAR